MEIKLLVILVLTLTSSALGALADPVSPAWTKKLAEELEDQERHDDHEVYVYNEDTAAGTENFPTGRDYLPYKPPQNYAPNYDPPNIAVENDRNEEARPSTVSSEPEQLSLTPQSGDLLTLLTDYMTLGYNYLDGNPEGGSFLLGGKDPGLRSGRPVFKLTYALGKKVYYNGKTLDEPDQVKFQNAAYCSSQKTVQLYSGTSSYQKKLDLHVAVSGSYDSGVTNFRFSLSTGENTNCVNSSTGKTI